MKKILAFCQQAVKNYNSFKHTVWKGDLYRLLNPHENSLASLMYVSKDQSNAVMFNLLVNTSVAITELPQQNCRFCLAGLDATKKYHVERNQPIPRHQMLRMDENKIYTRAIF